MKTNNTTAGFGRREWTTWALALVASAGTAWGQFGANPAQSAPWRGSSRASWTADERAETGQEERRAWTAQESKPSHFGRSAHLENSPQFPTGEKGFGAARASGSSLFGEAAGNAPTPAPWAQRSSDGPEETAPADNDQVWKDVAEAEEAEETEEVAAAQVLFLEADGGGEEEESVEFEQTVREYFEKAAEKAEWNAVEEEEPVTEDAMPVVEEEAEGDSPSEETCEEVSAPEENEGMEEAERSGEESFDGAEDDTEPTQTAGNQEEATEQPPQGVDVPEEMVEETEEEANPGEEEVPALEEAAFEEAVSEEDVENGPEADVEDAGEREEEEWEDVGDGEKGGGNDAGEQEEDKWEDLEDWAEEGGNDVEEQVEASQEEEAVDWDEYGMFAPTAASVGPCLDCMLGEDSDICQIPGCPNQGHPHNAYKP
jgi:hypothetical protein